VKTREERERDMCNAELHCENGSIYALMGWADWEIERQFLEAKDGN
jgi:hypothetical protein